MTLVRPTVATAAASPGGPATASQSGLPPNFRAKLSVQRPWMGAALAPSGRGVPSPSDRWAPVAVVGGAPQARAATGHRQEAGAGLASAKTDRTLRFRDATVGRRRIEPEISGCCEPSEGGRRLGGATYCVPGAGRGVSRLGLFGSSGRGRSGEEASRLPAGSLGGGPSGRARREGVVAPAMERADGGTRSGRCGSRGAESEPSGPESPCRGFAALAGAAGLRGGGGATFGGRPSNTRGRAASWTGKSRSGLTGGAPGRPLPSPPVGLLPELKPCLAPSTAAPH